MTTGIPVKTLSDANPEQIQTALDLTKGLDPIYPCTMVFTLKLLNDAGQWPLRRKKLNKSKDAI